MPVFEGIIAGTAVGDVGNEPVELIGYRGNGSVDFTDVVWRSNNPFSLRTQSP